MSPPHAWAPPQEFEEYRLVRRLGQGAMGQVYLAHDTLLDRFVAIKFIAELDANPVARERFLVEARAAARLQHPNVATVYRVGELDRHPYLVSEFIRGQSLESLDKPVPARRALELAIGLSRGLAAAHRRGVLHRDVKPANAILAEDGEVKLLDFGLAKLSGVDEAGSVPTSPAAPPAAAGAPGSPAPPARGRAATLDATAAAPRDGSGAAATGRAASLAATVAEGAVATFALPGDGAATHDPGAGGDATLPLPRDLDLPVHISHQGPGSASPSLTRAGDLIGTPLYMAPESWRGEPATPRSDVYSLAAVIFELCSGRAPARGGTVFELGRRVLEQPAPTLQSVVPTIDARFAAVIDRGLQRDPAARFATADGLRDALEALVEADRGVATPEGNPYRGLLAFEAEHRGVFFGRGRDTRTVLARLRAEPFVLVAGDSGVGKSSLCRAGVLPAVTDGALGEGRTWSVVTVVPGRHPAAALAAALAPRLGRPEEVLLGELEADPGALGRELRRSQGAATGTVLFVDQSEELATLADAEEARAVGEMLGGLAGGAPRGGRLATARGDFLTRLAALPGLGPEIAPALHLLAPLGPDATREAIVGPARAKGVSFESAALVEELVTSSTEAASGLPLLQFALAELWEARDRDRAVITAAALASIGGVAGALARHADAVLQGLMPAPRRAARRLLTDLVTAAGTRGRRTEAELTAGDPAAAVALEALVRGRLLCAQESEEETGYEVAHEALLTGWTSLRRWLEAEAGTRAVRHRVAAAAAEWERLGRADEALWGARQLAEAAPLDAADLAPREEAFLGASAAGERRRRRRRLALAFAVPVILAATYGGFALAARHELRGKVDRHLRAADEALGEARRGEAAVAALRRQAFARFDARERDAGEAAWSRAATRAATAERAYGRASQALETALNLDPRRPDVRARFAAVLYARALVAERERRGSQRDELLQRLALYDDDGALGRRWRAPAEITFVSRPAGARVHLEGLASAGAAAPGAAPRDLGATPTAPTTAAPGSYLARLEAPGRSPVAYPLLLQRGERRTVTVSLPLPGDVPAGYVYVPGGTCRYGSAADDGLRRGFYTTVPQHPVTVASFLIARHETTFADWIEYLRALPAAERARHLPRVSSIGFRGSLHLQPTPGGWRLSFQPATRAYSAAFGETVTYAGRPRRAVQDWRRFPVSGVSFADARDYAAWLARTGRVPGARLCTELEWERAARGADGREYPHGRHLEPDDANIDETYGKRPEAFGPDEVGSHPASRSPFGVDDLAGNVWEWTVATQDPKEPAALRGGSYYHDRKSSRADNRATPEPTLRDPAAGIRICASAPGR